jgi:hypothetical protein
MRLWYIHNHIFVGAGSEDANAFVTGIFIFNCLCLRALLIWSMFRGMLIFYILSMYVCVSLVTCDWR